MGFLWRALDQVHCLLPLAQLRLVDALYGPEPETPADEARNRDRSFPDGRSDRELS
jgi:hypothetical protein